MNEFDHVEKCLNMVTNEVVAHENDKKRARAELDLALARLNDISTAFVLTLNDWEVQLAITQEYFGKHHPEFTDWPVDRVKDVLMPVLFESIKAATLNEIKSAQMREDFFGDILASAKDFVLRYPASEKDSHPHLAGLRAALLSEPESPAG